MTPPSLSNSEATTDQTEEASAWRPPQPHRDSSRRSREPWRYEVARYLLAGLAVLGVLAAVGAELAHGQPVGVVAAVLAGDVVAVLALDAGHGDLGSDVGGLGGHGLPVPVR